MDVMSDFLWSNCRSYADVLALARQHPAFEGQDRLGTPGFSVPDILDMELIEVSSETLPRLLALGIEVTGPFGQGNVVVTDRTMQPVKLQVAFVNCTGNAVILDRKAFVSGNIRSEGHENLFMIGSACPFMGRGLAGLNAIFHYGKTAFVLGAGGSAAGISVWIEGPGRAIQVGDDYMFAWGISLRTADAHGLIDLVDKKRVNPSRSILIDRHVWLAADVTVMAGAKIGAGSVIGTKSVVTRPIPPTCVAAGIPARVVRRRASWTRKHNPSEAEIAALSDEFLFLEQGL
jgi:acetyltransferase-like isoleucine patch superfamily enzyme